MTEEKDLSKDPKVQKITEELQDYYEESAPDEASSSEKSSLHAINEHLNQYYQATLSDSAEGTEEKSSRIESILGTSQPERIEAAMSHPIEKFMSIPQEPKQPEDSAEKSELDQVLDNLFVEEEEGAKPPAQPPRKEAEKPSLFQERTITEEEGDYLAKAKPPEEEGVPAIAPEEEEEISTYLTNLFGEKPPEEISHPELKPPTEPGLHFVETAQEKPEEELFMEEKEEEKIVVSAAREAEALEEAKIIPEAAPPMAAAAEAEVEAQDPLQLGVIKASLNHQAEINASLVPINNYMMGVLSELDKKVGNVREYFQARRTLEEMYQHLQQLPKNASIQEVLKIAEELVSSKGKIATSATAAGQELAEAENVARLMKETAEQFLKAVQKTKEQIDKDTLA